jgi:hypothetical protein
VSLGRAATVAVAVVVACATLAACDGGGDASGGDDGGAAARDELFARRGRAVLAHDEAAFLATSAPELRAAEERLWAGLTSVPFARYEVADGVVRWQLTGFDGPPAVDRVRYTTGRRAGRLVVTGTDGPVDHELWDAGAVTVSTSAHVTLLAAGPRPDLLAAAATAYADVAAAIEIPMPDRVLVLVPRSDDELRALLGGAPGTDVDEFTAFTVAGTGPTAPVGAGQPRVVVRDGAPGPRPDTWTHELVHAAAYPVAPRAPVWIHEGLAEWVAHGRPAPAVVTGSDGRLPSDAEFLGAAPQVSYGEAESAIAFLAAQRGVGAPWSLLRAVGGGATEDTALATVWGGDRRAFETAWSAEVAG